MAHFIQTLCYTKCFIQENNIPPSTTMLGLNKNKNCPCTVPRLPAVHLTASFSCRCGFAGETGPRFIIPSEIRRPGQQQVRRQCVFLDACEKNEKCMLTWCVMSHLQAINVVQYNINTEELYVILKEFIHILYFR